MFIQTVLLFSLFSPLSLAPLDSSPMGGAKGGGVPLASKIKSREEGSPPLRDSICAILGAYCSIKTKKRAGETAA